MSPLGEASAVGKEKRAGWGHRPAPLGPGTGPGCRAVPLAVGETWLSAELGRQGAMQDLGWRARDGGRGGGEGREPETRSPRPWAWEGVGCVPSPWQHCLKSSGNPASKARGLNPSRAAPAPALTGTE